MDLRRLSPNAHRSLFACGFCTSWRPLVQNIIVIIIINQLLTPNDNQITSIVMQGSSKTLNCRHHCQAYQRAAASNYTGHGGYQYEAEGPLQIPIQLPCVFYETRSEETSGTMWHKMAFTSENKSRNEFRKTANSTPRCFFWIRSESRSLSVVRWV